MTEQDPWQHPEMVEYVKHAREELLPKMADSAISITLMPTEDVKTDIKFATELGCAILMDKPIIVVAVPGAEVPEQLRKVAHAVVQGDITSKETKADLQAAITKVVAYLDKEKR